MNSKAINKLDLVLNLTSFKKFTEKHLYQSLFFNKVAGLGQVFRRIFSRTPLDYCFWFFIIHRIKISNPVFSSTHRVLNTKGGCLLIFGVFSDHPLLPPLSNFMNTDKTPFIFFWYFHYSLKWDSWMRKVKVTLQFAVGWFIINCDKTIQYIRFQWLKSEKFMLAPLLIQYIR